jgi:hypothetical protein
LSQARFSALTIPPVHHPHPVRPSEARLHARDDLLDRGHIGGVAGEDLVAKGHAFARDYQGNVHLHAIGPVITRVAALGNLRVGHALEVGAGHIVEQQIVVELEQLSEALDQVLLDRLLVRQQPVQRSVQPLLVEALGSDTEQVFERCGAVPALGHVQLAAGLAQSADHQNGNHIGPAHRLPAPRQQTPEQLIELERMPQQPPQPHRPEAPRALQPHRIEPHGGRFHGRIRFEQTALRTITRAPRDSARQHCRACTSLGIEFPEVYNRLLSYLAPASH